MPDVMIFYPDGTIFSTTVASDGYSSLTHARLADPAPQTLTPGSPVPVFVGRTGPKWHDTGLNLTALTGGGGSLKTEVNRHFFSIQCRNQDPHQIYMAIANSFLRRFGGKFYPTITPGAPTTIRLDSMYIDDDKPFAPVSTPWEIRWIYNPSKSFYLGGVGGHPGSSLRSDVADQLYRTQDLCTY